MPEKIEKLLLDREKSIKKLFEALDALDDNVNRICRRIKVQALIDECVNLQHIVAEKNTKLSKSDSEGVRAEATANAEQVNDRCKQSLEEARNYVFAQSPKSQKSKQSTKRSKTSSKARALVELQLEQEELERQAEAQKKLLEAEMHMKALQIEEATRKKVQAAKDKACLASIEDDESDNDPEESVISAKENAATKTAKWVNDIVANRESTEVRSEPILSFAKTAVTSAGNFPLSSSSNFVPNQQTTQLNCTRNPPPGFVNKPIFSNCAPAQNVQFHVPNSTTNAVPTLVPPSNHALPTVQTGLPAANLQSFFDTRLFQESLPKLNLECFSGDPLKWPEWKGMFQSTCCHPSVSNDHKMRYLKLFTAGKAKATIEGFGFGGNFFEHAFAALQRRFGSPHLVVGAQIDKMSKHPPVKMHNSEAIIEFSQAVDAFVSVLSSEQYFSDLQSSSNLSLLVSKLPINLREQWFAFTENSKSAVNLVSFRDWLQKKAMIHERLLLSSTMTEKCEQKPERVRRANVFATSVSNSTDKQRNNQNSCPLCQGSHKLWKCGAFLGKSVKQRSTFARDSKLCFSCLQAGHMSKDCKMDLKCIKKGCKKSHNVLLHIENSEKSGKATGIATASENSIASCTVAQARREALQVLEIGLRNGSSEAKAWALCDTGSTHSWVSEKLRSEMGLKGSHEVVFVRGVTGTIEGSTRCVDLELFSLEDNKFVPLKFSALVRPGLYLGNEKLDLRNLKHDCSHLKHVVADVIDYSKI